MKNYSYLEYVEDQKAHEACIGGWIKNYRAFPTHNGMPAWSFPAGNIKHAYLWDYTWREFANRLELVISLATKVFPEARIENDRIYLSKNFNLWQLSLQPDSCGAYSLNFNPNRGTLWGKDCDSETIAYRERSYGEGGFTPAGLLMEKLGYRKDSIVGHLADMGLIKNVSPRERVLYAQKPLYSPEYMDMSFREVVARKMKTAFPTFYGYKPKDLHPYFTEDGRLCCFNGIFENSENSTVNLIYSYWHNEITSSQLDCVNWPYKKLPYNFQLYFDNAANRDIVVLCTSESMVEDIRANDIPLFGLVNFISYFDSGDTDWHYIKDKVVFILPDNSSAAYQKAINIYSVLSSAGVRQIRYIPRQSNSTPWQDFRRYAVEEEKAAENMSFKDFCIHARNRFDSRIPDGVLLKAVPLFSQNLSGKKNRISIIPYILDEGTVLMIHAFRGVGKSLLANFFALNFAC